MSNSEDLYLSTADKWGRQTIVSTETYVEHTAGKETRDGDTRARAAIKIESVLKNPRYVYCDVGHEGRVKYLDVIADSTIEPRMGALVVIVDPRLEPQEVVSWIWVTRLSKEDFSGGIIYDSAQDSDSSR